MQKPGNWFLLPKFLKKPVFSQVFFKHFGSKNQLPGLSIIGTLVENGLILQENFGGEL